MHHRSDAAEVTLPGLDVVLRLTPAAVDLFVEVFAPSPGQARQLYERTYCRRGEAENHIKAWKAHLASDRTSCCRASANQMRLFLHIAAYWLIWSLRSLMPKRSSWRRVVGMLVFRFNPLPIAEPS